jgi:hypothetical protein
VQREYFSAVIQYVNEGSFLHPVWNSRLILFGGRSNQDIALNSTVSIDSGTFHEMPSPGHMPCSNSLFSLLKRFPLRSRRQ